ncbi:MAG: 30S ribosomal protein S10 [Candidatus Bostrichicola ureolyticus]|nr:MAG: 30S ribosomal protein S10 [Candidatus Bostrichicola ureolyticus]
MSQNIRIKLQSYDHLLLDNSMAKIIKSVIPTGVIIKGPIPLPTVKKIYTVLRSPHVNKKSREQYVLPKHKRFLEICNARSTTIDALMKLELASGVEVKIKV